MIRQMRTTRPAVAALFFLAASTTWTPAWAQANVVLENLTSDAEKSTVAIRRIELVGTNLTQDEAKKLFSTATRQEAADLLAKLEARQVLIPETVVRQKDKPGAITLRDFQANDVSMGKAARLSLAAVDGEGANDKGARVTIKAGAVTVDNLDIGAALAALKGGDPMDGLTKATRVTSNGFELTMPDPETPADAPGGNMVKLSLGSFGVDQAYDGDTPTRSAIALNNFIAELPKASKGGAQLAAQGLDRVQANIHFGGAYDPARRSYALDDFSIEADKLGSLRLRGELGSIDKSAFSGAQQQRLAALMGADASMLELRFVNTGVFEKIVASVGKEQNKTPAALVAEWKAMSGMLAQAFGQGDPTFVRASDAAAKFLDNPRSMTISVKGKTGPVKFIELAALKNPMELLGKVNVEFFTEKAAVAAPAAVAPAAAPAAQGKLKGAAAWNALLGNTVSGKDSDGDPLFELYSADGRLKQLDDDTITSGKWALRGEKVCILYSGSKDESCYDVEVFGDSATFTDEDGDGARYKILKGNPKGL